MADRPLHILIAGINWPPETFIARLIEGLLGQGLTITVATAQKPPASWLRQPGFNWLHTPSWDEAIAKRLLHLSRTMLRALLLAPSAIKHFTKKPLLLNWHMLLPFAKQQWDVIYFPWNSAAVAYLPLFDLGRPVVVSCRGSQINVAPHDPQRAEYVAGLRVTLDRATAVHCVSEAIKQEATHYGLDPQKAWVIQPAVDPNYFHPLPSPKPPPRPLRLITTGSLTWRKGYEHMLLAMRQLLDRQIPICLEIIGDGPERQRVLYTIEDLGLQEVVHLTGHLPPDQVRDKLQQAHVFLLTSLSEGISNAVLEAMACGLPVVTTDCGGMREAVTDGVEGFIVPTADPQAMAQAVHDLWQQPQLGQQMGQAGRQRVEKEFDLAQQANQFANLFLQACGRFT